LGIGFFSGRKYAESGGQIRIKEVTKDKIVTITKEVVRPGGIVEREIVKTEDKRTEVAKIETKPVPKPDWAITVMAGQDLQQAIVHRRIFSQLYLNLALQKEENNGRLLIGGTYEF